MAGTTTTTDWRSQLAIEFTDCVTSINQQIIDTSIADPLWQRLEHLFAADAGRAKPRAVKRVPKGYGFEPTRRGPSELDRYFDRITAPPS
jgi:hypothetical protein